MVGSRLSNMQAVGKCTELQACSWAAALLHWSAFTYIPYLPTYHLIPCRFCFCIPTYLPTTYTLRARRSRLDTDTPAFFGM